MSEPEAIAVKDRRRGQRAIPTGKEVRSAGLIRRARHSKESWYRKRGRLIALVKSRPAQMVPPPLDVS